MPNDCSHVNNIVLCGADEDFDEEDGVEIVSAGSRGHKSSKSGGAGGGGGGRKDKRGHRSQSQEYELPGGEDEDNEEFGLDDSEDLAFR